MSTHHCKQCGKRYATNSHLRRGEFCSKTCKEVYYDVRRDLVAERQRKKLESEYYAWTKPCPTCGGAMMPHTWFSDYLRTIQNEWDSWLCTNCGKTIDFGSFSSFLMKIGFNRGQPGRIGKFGIQRLRDLDSYANRSASRFEHRRMSSSRINLPTKEAEKN